MKKIVIFSLIFALMVVSIAPAIAAPEPAEAGLFDPPTISCDVSELHFHAYVGVPTYLLGFIPLDSQKVTITNTGGGLLVWKAEDDAGWLDMVVPFGLIGEGKSNTMSVSANNAGLEADTYTTTITISCRGATNNPVTIPVTFEVIEPKVLGPLMIGIVGETDECRGLTTQLLTNPDDAMDMQAIETDGCWNLIFTRGEEMPDGSQPLIGGTLTVGGESKEIAWGMVAGLDIMTAMMPPGALPFEFPEDLGENYVVLFTTSDGVSYLGILLADLPALLPMLSGLGDLFVGGDPEASLTAPDGDKVKPGANANEVTPGVSSPDIVIPLQPILELLPVFMPILSDLLGNETVLEILEPLMDLLPPIMIVMPLDMLLELAMGML
ncbi:MAG: hypothetical protein U9N44_06870 [Chloroflexota bacterium]|nr:hypothetical protein [Chloroflexota bacterium]